MLLWKLSLVVAGVSGGVVAAVDGWVVVQLSGQKVVYGGVGVAAGSAVEADAGGRQGILGALTDSATDECIDAFALEQVGQRAVTGSVAVEDMGFTDGVVFDGVYLKLAGFAEVLENLSVFIGDG